MNTGLRIRVGREMSGIRQDDLAAEMRRRGHKMGQCDLSHFESGVRPISAVLARELADVLVAIAEARLKALRELLSI
jgi:hypothetical protein